MTQKKFKKGDRMAVLVEHVCDWGEEDSTMSDIHTVDGAMYDLQLGSALPEEGELVVLEYVGKNISIIPCSYNQDRSLYVWRIVEDGHQES